MITQISKIQFRRGLQSDLPISNTTGLDVGEVAFTTDTNRVFIGTDPSTSNSVTQIHNTQNISSGGFPYSNVEILTEFSPANQTIFDNEARNITTAFIVSAPMSLTGTGTWATLNLQVPSGLTGNVVQQPFTISTENGTALISYHIIDSLTNTPLKNGTLTIFNQNNSSELIDTGTMNPNAGIIGNSSTDPNFIYGAISFRTTSLSDGIGIQYQINITGSNLPVPLMWFRVEQPQGDVVIDGVVLENINATSAETSAQQAGTYATEASISAASASSSALAAANSATSAAAILASGSLGITLNNIAALRANISNAPVIIIRGYYNANDGGDGTFLLNNTDTNSADNGGTIIVDAAQHRYYRVISNSSGIEPQWFGALGNGITDDTAALNATAVIAAGGVLKLMPGKNYIVSAPIFIYSGTTLDATGASITSTNGSWTGVYPNPGPPGSVAGNPNYCFVINKNWLASVLTDKNITIIGGTFNWTGSLATNGNTHSIQFRKVSNTKIINSNFIGGGDGTAHIGCAGTLVQGCVASGTYNAGYDHWGGTQNSRVINCKVYGADNANSGYGILFNAEESSSSDTLDSEVFIAIGNQISGVTTGIFVDPLANGSTNGRVIIQGNYIKCTSASNGNGYSPLAIRGNPGYFIINGNIIENSLKDAAIAVYASPVNGNPPVGIILTDNIILNCSTTGSTAEGLIDVHGSKSVFISGNVVAGGNYTCFISVNGCDTATIMPNICQGYTTGQKYNLSGATNLILLDTDTNGTTTFNQSITGIPSINLGTSTEPSSIYPFSFTSNNSTPPIANFGGCIGYNANSGKEDFSLINQKYDASIPFTFNQLNSNGALVQIAGITNNGVLQSSGIIAGNQSSKSVPISFVGATGITYPGAAFGGSIGYNMGGGGSGLEDVTFINQQSTSAMPYTFNLISNSATNIYLAGLNNVGSFVLPILATSTEYANDAAAAAGGVQVYSMYLNTSGGINIRRT